MTSEITLIFPDQLFQDHPALDLSRTVLLAEEFLFFRVQFFHRQRLILLRAAMKNYADYLKNLGYKVIYLESHQLKKRGELFDQINKHPVKTIHLAEFNDDWLRQDLDTSLKKNKWSLKFYKSPGFMCSEDEIRTFFEEKKVFSMAQFYSYQRKKFRILMEGNSPVGGKFSFDADNRKKLPKGLSLPAIYQPKSNNHVVEAISYVDEHFQDAVGESESFMYPVTFEDAQKALKDFIDQRLALFGDYEDAIEQNESHLFHSVLSPLINIGLLTPQEVVKAVMQAYKENKAPLNSVEGFVRQIMGWREFIRACYLLKGREERSSNFFNHHSRLPEGFWEGKTGILPLDQTIRRILKTGYCHHIERLMVLGNFLLLTETDPKEVYTWFMGFFIDSYDWVMVPNVYGMSQYSKGGGMTTKPYISGSNYILKMSNYSKKDEWVELWDGLFWRFLTKHKKLFSSNPRTRVLLDLYQKNHEKILPKIEKANQFIS